MGWGTDFKAEIYLNRRVFGSKYELEEAIKESDSLIESFKKELYMYASSNVRDIVPSEWGEESISYIKREIGVLLESLEEETILAYKLSLLLENFDERVSD
jgi:hypothetical protein